MTSFYRTNTMHMFDMNMFRVLQEWEFIYIYKLELYLHVYILVTN